MTGISRWGVLAAMAAALCGLWSCARPSSKAPVAIGGPFHLVDQNGASVNQSILRGKWTAVFFGYTYCPDACPTTLATLAKAQAALGARAHGFQVVFISVDPARDTPAQLKSYLSNSAFPRGAWGLTGAPAQIAATARAYHVYYAKVGTGADYSVDHTSIVYLMDPDGAFSRPLDFAAPPAQLAGQVLKAMDAR